MRDEKKPWSKIVFGKPEGKEPLVRHGRKWDNNEGDI
jgi:hypothetical protein